jgi:hypothetical protein
MNKTVKSSYLPQQIAGPPQRELGGESKEQHSLLSSAIAGAISIFYLAALTYPVFKYLALRVERARAKSAVPEISGC